MNRTLPQNLARALQTLTKSNGRSGLDSVYGRLPDTTCDRRGHCCGLLPPVQHIELLVWLSELLALPCPDRALEATKLLEHFLFNAAQRRQCPWLEPGRCSIYERRFFGCRAYGLWSPETYKQRRIGSVEAAAHTVRTWASMGVNLPPDVLGAGPDYCLCVEPVDRRNAINDEELQRLEEQLVTLSDGLPGAEMFGQWGGDISYATAWLVLGPQAALVMKVETTKAILAGDLLRTEDIKTDSARQVNRWAFPKL